MRAQFANFAAGAGAEKSLWELMLMQEVPASHPQFSEYLYMCEDEEISQIYPMLDGGECVVPMSVKHMGAALEMIKSVHNSQINPNEEEVTASNFIKAHQEEAKRISDDKLDFFKRLTGCD